MLLFESKEIWTRRGIFALNDSLAIAARFHTVKFTNSRAELLSELKHVYSIHQSKAHYLHLAIIVLSLLSFILCHHHHSYSLSS
jgi:hypothetical protein